MPKNYNPTKPHHVAKHHGFKTLKELSEYLGESVQTLNNWFKNERRRFDLIVMGAAYERVKTEDEKWYINKNAEKIYYGEDFSIFGTGIKLEGKFIINAYYENYRNEGEYFELKIENGKCYIRPVLNSFKEVDKFLAFKLLNEIRITKENYMDDEIRFNCYASYDEFWNRYYNFNSGDSENFRCTSA